MDSDDKSTIQGRAQIGEPNPTYPVTSTAEDRLVLTKTGSPVIESSSQVTLPLSLAALLAEEDRLIEQLRNDLAIYSFSVDYHKKYITPACIKYQARLLEALDSGYESLAHSIIEFDQELGRKWSSYTPGIQKYGGETNPGEAYLDVLQIALTVPNDEPLSMVRMMLQGKLGQYLFNNGARPLALATHRIGLGVGGDRKQGYRPIIYGIIHCNDRGITPTKNQYLRILNRMKYYIDNSSKIGHAARDAYAARVDSAGCLTCPNLPADRDWARGIGNQIHDKWQSHPHPRRFAHSSKRAQSIKVFISGLEERLRKINQEDSDKPIPWHITYIGWSSKYEQRKAAHYEHAPGVIIKNLIETIAWLEFPDDEFLMHMFPLMNVTSPRMVRAEHVLSIMTASYSCYGGLNGISGGQTKDISKAATLPNQCWENGKLALGSEGFWHKNREELRRQVKMDKAFEEMEDLHANDVAIISKRKKLEEEEYALEVEAAKVREAYKAAVEERIVEHGKSEFLKLENALKFVLEGEELLHNHELGQPPVTKCCSSAS